MAAFLHAILLRSCDKPVEVSTKIPVVHRAGWIILPPLLKVHCRTGRVEDTKNVGRHLECKKRRLSSELDQNYSRMSVLSEDDRLLGMKKKKSTGHPGLTTGTSCGDDEEIRTSSASINFNVRAMVGASKQKDELSKLNVTIAAIG